MHIACSTDLHLARFADLGFKGFGTTTHSSLLCVWWFRVESHLFIGPRFTDFEFFAIRYTDCWIEFWGMKTFRGMWSSSVLQTAGFLLVLKLPSLHALSTQYVSSSIHCRVRRWPPCTCSCHISCNAGWSYNIAKRESPESSSRCICYGRLGVDQPRFSRPRDSENV